MTMRRPAQAIASFVLATLGIVYAQDAVPALSLSGQIRDAQSLPIFGATVTLNRDGSEPAAVNSDHDGSFVFDRLNPGRYTLRVAADGFEPYERRDLTLPASGDTHLEITLPIAVRRQQITVISGTPVPLGAEYGANSMILRGDAINALPDGPGGLEMMLRALALRSSGPFGPQVLINGFEDSQLPPKSAIREIRINENPFSAEYPQLGLGRIEILTKPGSNLFHGEQFFMFGDESLNSRNPFSPQRVPFQSRTFGGNLSGPIVRNRASFFADYNATSSDSNAVINAATVSPAFIVTPFQKAVITPERRLAISPRLDLQLNSKNTLVVRYSDVGSRLSNAGIGDFSLESRAQDLRTRVQSAQLTETSVLGETAVLETRMQYSASSVKQSGDNLIPTIQVPGGFTGGGAELGDTADRARRADVQSFMSLQLGSHSLKYGLQGKFSDRTSDSDRNFNGTFTFNGRLAPQLNSTNEIVIGPGGLPAMTPITSIEAYRRTVLFRSQGLSAAIIRTRGGGASQFSQSAGLTGAGLQQYELGAFFEDSWRVHPKFSVNLGLRYERQNNISNPLNLGPRAALAWGPGDGKTVVRAGAGIFYTRVEDTLVLRARQLNGINQRQFITSDAALLDSFPQAPAARLLSSFSVLPSSVEIAPDLTAPYTIHSSASIERQLGRGFTAAVTYTRVKALRMLRSRNINPPAGVDASGKDVRPIATLGNVFAYESTGRFDQDQVLINLVYQGGKNVSLWTTYTWRQAMSDTDGPDTFPISTYDLSTEYGRSSQDVRHTVYWGGWIRVPGDWEFTPLVIWRTGMPYNITTGIDNNRDSLFTDRPSFAGDLSRPSVVRTHLGVFDLNPRPGDALVPRNYGTGPRFFIANLRVNKKFRLNQQAAISLFGQIQNLLNRTNPGLPIGVVSSPLFGLPNTAAGDWGFGTNAAGNRRIEIGVLFSR